MLLPAEIEFCKVVGCSKEQYFYFLDQQALYNGKRKEGYELIPDIRNDVVTAWVAKNIVSIGIAIASATVSYLLTPKPREIKQGESRRTADAIGNAKFAPQSSFDSIQSLANVGDIIPLIFANSQEKGGYGGVRVNSQLLWSQFVSLGKYQQLKVLNLFSLGAIDGEPDYQGYAIGDTLLNAYNAYKVGLYFRNGSESGNNRIRRGDLNTSSKLAFDNGNDPFEIGVPDNQGGGSIPTIRSKAFSGARNPTTQTRFGAYSPFPNAQVCRLPYELQRDARGATKEAGWDTHRKRKKVEFAKWPTRCGFLSASNGGNKGSQVRYQIVGTASGQQAGLQRVYNHEDKNADAFNYRPHGVDDVDSMTTAIRENADNLFAVGEQYLIGTAIAKCIRIPNPDPWTIDKTKSYFFEITEAGQLDIPVNNQSLWTHCQNPQWYDPPGSGSDKNASFSLSDTTPIFYQQYISGTTQGYGRGTNDLFHGWDIYTGQRVAIATVSNNRKVDVTEIGLKSRVYKHIRFANIDSQPDEDALERAFNDRSQITLGQIDRYITRIEFFMLQVRELGSDTWYDLKNGLSNHLGLFAVKGNTPEFQYNYISIHHPDNTKQYEYRFKPYPGNFITRGNNWNKRVNLLTTASGGNQTVNHFSSINQYGGFNITFSGDEAYYLNKDTEVLSNPEWQIGATEQTITGVVKKAVNDGRSNWQNNEQFNGVPTFQEWVTTTEDIDTIHRTIRYRDSTTTTGFPVGKYLWEMYWDGNGGQSAKENGGFDPGPGVGGWRDVIFKLPNDPKRYVPSQNSSGGHPDNKYWHFYIDIQQLRTITPSPHYSGLVPVIGGSGTVNSLRVNLTVYKQAYTDSNNVTQYYYYALWNIDSNYQGIGFKNGETAHLPSEADITGVGLPNRIQIQLEVGSRRIKIDEKNLNPYDVVADWNVYEGDENSNRNEPEHEIVYVNEILKPKTDNNGNEIGAAKYSDLAFAGIRINSSKEWTNFSQFSAYFKQGVKVEKLNSSGNGASNLFPEIAYALLTSSDIGAGKLVGSSSVDRTAMANAADYCKKNKFFWDGTISSKLNLRDFIFEHAGYCLLDFTIIGGKFSLKPSVPVNGDNEIDKRVLPEVKALFTDGNINDLQVSFLAPEERQTFKAAVLFRNEKENGFPETRSLLIRENDPHGSVSDPIETFDLSGFCTSRQQAEYFAFFAIRSRRLVDHGLTFKTAPQYVENLAPGDYFKLVSEVTHTSRFRNGAITPTGDIVSKDDLSGSLDIYYWKPGTTEVKEGTLNTTNVSAALFGTLFTVKNTTTENKIYKCETISYGEDGLLEVSGSYAPVESNGQLSVMQNWGLNNDASNFIVSENE